MQHREKKLREGSGRMPILLIAILAIGMAGCGGAEPVQGNAAPAPPPVPAPFQPQALEVTLGASGERVTLLTTESGGFTLNGEAFESGGNVTAGNGSRYTLTLADGTWTAQFDAHEIMVQLGLTEETVTITRAEDGSYWIGEMAVQSGQTIHTAENGNEYVLLIATDDDGAITWTASYRAPMIQVMLGLSGDTVTLEKGEDGSYWLDEMAVTSGETTAMAGNGNTYTLTMGEDGMWMAAYTEMVVDVMLGMSGETVSVRKAEDGSYWLGDMVVESGVTLAMASNGNRYRLMMGEDGMWMADYQPMTGTVTVGGLGVTLETMQAEDGSWTVVSPLTGEPETLTDGATFMVGGNSYTLMDDGEGNWTATYVEVVVNVMLGASGETVTLTRAEDRSYWLGEMRVEDGVTMVTAENGNQYTLSMNADGMWMAMHDAPETMVTLGTSGTTVTLVRDEDGTYTRDGEMFLSGGEVTAGNGNVYTVTLTDGVWMAEYQPESMEIDGTGGLMAVMREDGEGWDVEGALLSPNGMGDISLESGESYRVRMEDGMLVGLRLDKVTIDSQTRYRTDGLSAHPSIRGDDTSTSLRNEASTALVVADENYSFADLLGDGVSQTKGKNFVAEARMKLMEIREKIVSVLDVFDTDQERDDQVDRLWGIADSDNARTNVKSELMKVFGTSSFSDLTDGPDDDKALDEIDDLIAALSSADAMETALGDDGALKDSGADADDAAKIFAATETESTVTYGMLGNTRFGTITRKKRTDATMSAKYYDASATATPKKMGEQGAFAFGVTAETVRSRLVQTKGVARYEGATLAVSGAGKQYEGDIEISINFTSSKVNGLISNLMTTEGDAWEYLFGDVDTIVLPTQDLRASGDWMSGTLSKATIDFGLRAGVYRPQEVESTFKGRLLGGNTAPDAGSEVVGVWSVGSDVNAKKTDGSADTDAREAATAESSYLAGGFGAARVADEPVRPRVLDDGTQAKTVVVSNKGSTVIEDGMLKTKPTIQRWTWTGTDAAGNPSWPNAGTGTKYRDAIQNVEIQLAALLDKEGVGEVNVNSPQTHVQATRQLLQGHRDKIAGLRTIGGLTDEINEEWIDAQQVLLQEIFWDPQSSSDATVRTTRINGTWADQLPTKVNGGSETPAPADVLDRLDAVIEALSSKDSFEAAFDPGSDGIFVVDKDDEEKSFLEAHVGDGDDTIEANELFNAKVIENTTPGEMFGQLPWQVKAFSGTTDFTRFGAWRARHSKNALRAENWQNFTYTEPTIVAGLTKARGSELFAWSPLPAATATARGVRLPLDASATYTGKTVAYVNDSIPFEGEVSVEVRWFDATEKVKNIDTVRPNTPLSVGGYATVVFEDLRNLSTGDWLHYDNKPVRRLVTRQLNVMTSNSAALAFGNPADNDHRVRYSSGGFANLGVYYRDSSIAPFVWVQTPGRAAGFGSGGIAMELLEVDFLGHSPDGPLAVMGLWELARDDAGGTSKIGTKDTGGTPQNFNIRGAFGADLP